MPFSSGDVLLSFVHFVLLSANNCTTCTSLLPIGNLPIPFFFRGDNRVLTLKNQQQNILFLFTSTIQAIIAMTQEAQEPFAGFEKYQMTHRIRESRQDSIKMPLKDQVTQLLYFDSDFSFKSPIPVLHLSQLASSSLWFSQEMD